jgi:hypothetical protein
MQTSVERVDVLLLHGFKTLIELAFPVIVVVFFGFVFPGVLVQVSGGRLFVFVVPVFLDGLQQHRVRGVSPDRFAQRDPQPFAVHELAEREGLVGAFFRLVRKLVEDIVLFGWVDLLLGLVVSCRIRDVSHFMRTVHGHRDVRTPELDLLLLLPNNQS